MIVTLQDLKMSKQTFIIKSYLGTYMDEEPKQYEKFFQQTQIIKVLKLTHKTMLYNNNSVK